MDELWQTLLIALIPSLLTAIISSIASYCLSIRNMKSQLQVLSEQNKHEIDRLVKQHVIDLDNLKAKHKLEMESKDRDHKYALEIQQKNHESELLKLKQEGANNVTAELFKGVLGMAGTVISTPEGQKMLKENLDKRNT